MSIKSNYFKMSKTEFNNFLETIKNSTNTIHLLDDRFFFYNTTKINNILLELHKKYIELDSIINTFTEFSRKQIIQSMLINEIEATNNIESIYSTKHNIFSIINNISSSNDKKIISISNTYKNLLENKSIDINTCSDIRNIYDIILKNAISKDDLPDGKYFRLNPVYITNGLEIVHCGISNEDNIIKYINEFISLYNSDNDTFLKMILCHFIFEYIHPFYDGNGRIGRYLFTNGVYKETNSYFSFALATAFQNKKSKYYKAFSNVYDKYNFSSLNVFVLDISSILLDYINELIIEFKNKKNLLNNDINLDLTKSELKIYKFIYEASLFTHFGVSNAEIINELNISKRTLIYTLNKFKDNNILLDTKISKYTYHKIKI